MSDFPGAAFDRWLEAPYVEAAAREAAYEKFCEERDLDLDGDHWDLFDEWAADMMDDPDDFGPEVTC
jgi:hypothetical protein